MKLAMAVCGTAVCVLGQSMGFGAVLYDRTAVGSGSYNPGLSVIGTAGAVQSDVLLDDAAIPLARLGGMNGIEVTRVTFGVVRYANTTVMPWTGTPTDVSFVWGSETASGVNIESFGSKSYTSQWLTSPENVVIGDGVTTLFTTGLDFELNPGFGTVLVGMQFSNPSTQNAWLVSPNGHVQDFSSDSFFVYDSDSYPNELISVSFGGSFGGSFYMKVEGRPVMVPEPGAAAGLLAVAGVLTRRRR